MSVLWKKKKKCQENEEVNHKPRGHICKGYTWFFKKKSYKNKELQNSVIKNKQHNLKVDQKPKHWPCQREYMVDKHEKMFNVTCPEGNTNWNKNETPLHTY